MKLRTTLSILFILITNICSLRSILASDDQALQLPFIRSARQWWSRLHLPPLTTGVPDPEIMTIVRAIEEKARLAHLARLEQERKEREERDYFASLNTGFQERMQAIAASQIYRQGNQAALQSELARAIANRFRTEIFVDEVTATPHTLPCRSFSTTLTIRFRRGRRSYSAEITPEDIEVLGQRFPYLRSLDLSEIIIHDDELEALAQQPFVAHLTYLNINGRASNKIGYIFNKLTLKGIENSMGAFAALTSLDIPFNSIRDEEFRTLSRQVFAPNLTHLNIAHNYIKEIENSIGTFTSLVSLNIHCTGGNEGFAVIANQSFASNLIYLNIKGNRMIKGDRMKIEEIENSSIQFSRLTSLNVSNKILTDEALNAIAQQPFAENLTELNISRNRITLEGIKINIGAFKRLTILKISSRHKRALGNGVLTLLAAQSFAPNLISLGIKCNSLTAKGIGKSIGAFKSLTNLDIGVNPIEDKGLSILANQSFASNLISLNISLNSLTAEGIKESIGKFKSLTYLKIDFNPITSEGFEAIAALPLASRLDLRAYKTEVTAEWIQNNKHKFSYV